MLTVAAVLIALESLGHSILGERDTLGPLLSEDATARTLDDPAKQRLLRVAWHQGSLAWLIIAAHLVYMGDQPDPRALALYAVLFALNLGTNTWATRRTHPSMLLLAGATVILIGVALTTG
jgi:hypothetical protein